MTWWQEVHSSQNPLSASAHYLHDMPLKLHQDSRGIIHRHALLEWFCQGSNPTLEKRKHDQSNDPQRLLLHLLACK
jgi:hypothetical protein